MYALRTLARVPLEYSTLIGCNPALRPTEPYRFMGLNSQETLSTTNSPSRYRRLPESDTVANWYTPSAGMFT